MSVEAGFSDKTAAPTVSPRAAGRYAVVWRLHFYAGLLCIPFVLWLALTGSLYLFAPQIDSWIDRRFDRLEVGGPPAAPSAQVKAALAAVEGSVLSAYEVPAGPQSAVRVLVGRGKDLFRVYVHPRTLEVLKVTSEDSRLTRLLFNLHGELLLGRPGSMMVEFAASISGGRATAAASRGFCTRGCTSGAACSGVTCMPWPAPGFRCSPCFY
jgi:uncharacterized iron-regulated membrane protein